MFMARPFNLHGVIIYGLTTLRNVLDRLLYLEPYPDLQCDGFLSE